MRIRAFAFGALVSAMMASTVAAAPAEEPKVEAFVEVDGTQFLITLEGDTDGLKNFVINVVGPRDFMGTVKDKEKIPVIDLKELGEPTEGVYRFEVSAATPYMEPIPEQELKDERDKGRGKNAKDERHIGVTADGVLRLFNGELVLLKDREEDGSEKPQDGREIPDDDGERGDGRGDGKGNEGEETDDTDKGTAG